MSALVQFAPLKTAISVAFWHALARRKLDEYGLSDAAVPVRALWRSGSALLRLDYDAFDPAAPAPPAHHSAPGALFNTNTLDDYKKMNAKRMLEGEAEKVWRAVASGEWESDPGCLTRVLVACHADLKRHEFRYIAACPALRWASGDVVAAGPPRPLSSALSPERAAELRAVLEGCPVAVVPAEGPVVRMAPGAWRPGAVLAVADACEEREHPGWPLRNVLLAMAATHGLRRATVLCVRPSGGLVLDVELPEAPQPSGAAPQAVGWELQDGRLQSRVVSLAHTMDPLRLAETAVDLNLKLMRWRMFPALDLDAISATRCLLLGAGTLGCNGWGVRSFTFVDNARVSFSNPVRQSLFTFEDCLDGGKFKALAAAERLKAIFPSVNAEGRVMTIPMPGHYVGKDDEARARAATEELDELVRSHDAVFLLSDSRECRWLPTLLGTLHSKLVLTVGLGFESYVVMRHGVPAAPDRVGCYFCSDVVAPRDSITDRTLDQACTVTRPGLSFIAAALAAELMVSVLHHPLRASAPANATGCPLGPVPHQIRGFLSEWSTVRLAGEASRTCVACSPQVVAEYEARGFAFLLDVFNNPAFLEELSGLNELRRQQQTATADGIEWATAEEDDF
eukprot:m51a1_g13222 putative ubiquitin-like modifier-activating enzyme atg7 isoform x1 (623) ;mRNA; r:36-2527